MQDTQVRLRIVASIEQSIAVKQAVLDSMIDSIATAGEWLAATLLEGHKVLLFGNGGSAADSQHLAAEFIGRFEQERRPWPVLALTTDSSILTALSNDYGVEVIFSRQIEAFGQEGDLAIAFSTSGNSANVLEGARAARRRGMRIIAFTGQSGGQLAGLSDLALCVPSQRTARIQEAHIAIYHALSDAVEAQLTKHST